MDEASEEYEERTAARHEALLRDAARYRWLRNGGWEVLQDPKYWTPENKFDGAIDAAMLDVALGAAQRRANARVGRRKPSAGTNCYAETTTERSMSYDIELIDPVTKELVELDAPHHMHGEIYAIGGSTQAHLNVTYNYGGIFRRVLGDKGIRTIYGTTGAESLPLLEGAAAQLGDDVDQDYWAATDGNAKRALMQLAALAKMRPDAVWAGD